jgi:hypothetical protein
VPSLVRGHIVYSHIAIPDPQGQNPKQGHPFVVISRDEDIKKGDSIHAIGIVKTIKVPDPNNGTNWWEQGATHLLLAPFSVLDLRLWRVGKYRQLSNVFQRLLEKLVGLLAKHAIEY